MPEEHTEAWKAAGGGLATVFIGFAYRLISRARKADSESRLSSLERWTKTVDARIDAMERRILDGELGQEEQERKLRKLHGELREGLRFDLETMIQDLRYEIRQLLKRKRDVADGKSE